MQVQQYTTLEQLALPLSQLPQADTVTRHLFVAGSYLRELDLPADTIVIGRRHKRETINIVLRGTLILIEEDENGKLTEPRKVSAPAVIVSEAGVRKIARSLTDAAWLNVFSTDATTPVEAENDLVHEDHEITNTESCELAHNVLIKLGVQPCQ